MPIMRPHGKVDTPKPRDFRSRACGPRRESTFGYVHLGDSTEETLSGFRLDPFALLASTMPRRTGESCQPSRVDHPRSSLLHSNMRCDQRSSPSRPPTPHDRRVVPTTTGRPPAVFTFPPRQDEPWPEGRSTFPGELAFTASGFSPASGFGPAFTASGFSPASGSGPAFTTSGFGLASGFGPASGFSPAFTASGFGPASGFDLAFTALGFGLAFTALGFSPTFRIRPRIGFRPSIYCIGLRPHFWDSAPHRAFALHLLHRDSAPLLVFGPTFGLRPRIYCIEFRPCFGFGHASGFGPASTASGFGPTSGFSPAVTTLGFSPASGSSPAFTAWGFGLALGFDPALGSSPAFIASGFGPTSGFSPASGLDPAFTTFGPRPSIYCFRASALHLLLLGFGPTFTAFRRYQHDHTSDQRVDLIHPSSAVAAD
ncbi:hypothetical protein CRG98_012065 [Punica granatum]|uniref:Uncharacterized protein n=1 Tax=Punica granatum TaxID=22663 RepID=A0A2I0KG58_PUNGR|nr:hypothetical protein CRG98_012065 [Punica granatum]